MFEDLTVEGIKGRILSRLTTELQTREGSFTNDVISASAAEICECYHSLDALLPAFYVDETSGTYIDRQAGMLGIVRKAGTLARCSISFTGEDGASVPVGTPFYTAAGLAFYLEQAVTVADGVASGTLIAAQVGDAYNVGAGDIVATLRNYTGITSYTNCTAAGGSDPESDASLLGRYLERMRRTATSGNPYHYQLWATSVDGVGAARVISKWDGAGTVKVVLAGVDMEPPVADVVTACGAYIESQRPVGPAVTTVAAGAQELAVAVGVTIDGTTTKAEVKISFETAVRDYLNRLAREAFADNIDLQLEPLNSKSYTVLYNRIAFLLLSIPGVVDYTALTVGGGTANITIDADKLPVLTGVTVT
ncbi:MAG: baseplate J/gp47 family protein [Lawsonibacter sp.]|nr:baseplate J/gp47 family protein [Lawsonibacter sp.]